MEHILDSHIFWGKLKYLVCWKRYGIEEDEWRPSEDVKGAKRLVSEFHWQTLKHPNISQPPTSISSPFASSPTSWIPQTQSPHIGLLANACQDAMPLRGG